jgi:hypothetical protein
MFPLGPDARPPALAFNKNGDEAGVLRFSELTLLTYA